MIKYRIATVDDDVEMQDIQLELLGPIFDVRQFFSSSEAITALSGDYQPDAIITDFFLNGESGATLIEFCTRRKLSFPILVTSGEPDVWKNIFEQGLLVSFILEKPFRIEFLVSQLMNAIFSYKVADNLKMVHFYLLQQQYLSREFEELQSKGGSQSLEDIQIHLKNAERHYRAARAAHHATLKAAESFNPRLASILETHSEKSFFHGR